MHWESMWDFCCRAGISWTCGSSAWSHQRCRWARQCCSCVESRLRIWFGTYPARHCLRPSVVSPGRSAGSDPTWEAPCWPAGFCSTPSLDWWASSRPGPQGCWVCLRGTASSATRRSRDPYWRQGEWWGDFGRRSIALSLCCGRRTAPPCPPWTDPRPWRVTWEWSQRRSVGAVCRLRAMHWTRARPCVLRRLDMWSSHLTTAQIWSNMAWFQKNYNATSLQNNYSRGILRAQ